MQYFMDRTALCTMLHLVLVLNSAHFLVLENKTEQLATKNSVLMKV